MNEDEITINILDLIRRCLMKWKLMIVCILVGAIVLNGIGYLHSVKNANEVRTQIQQMEEEQDDSVKLITINEYMRKLSDREISEVQTALLSYKTYQQEYVEGLKYYQESVRMKLDPNCVPTLRLQYIIDNHYEVMYPVIEKRDTTQDIISILTKIIQSEDVINAIAEVLGLEKNAAYAQELLSSWGEGRDIMVIYITAENREDCESIAEIVKQKIIEQTDDVRMACGEYDIALVSEQFFHYADTNLMTAQQSVINSLNSLRSSIYNLPNGMTEDQKVYYYALLDNEEKIDLSDPNDPNENNEIEVPELAVPEIQYVSLKYICLGMLCGIFFACALIGVKYVLSVKLRVPEDIEDSFALHVIGNITNQQIKRPEIFKKAYHNLSEDEQIQLILSEIQVSAEKENMENVFITSASVTERSKQICREICNAVNEKGISCTVGKSMVYDPQTIKQAACSDGVVLVEQIDESRYDEIAKEKELCSKYHVPIIGCVVVE